MKVAETSEHMERKVGGGAGRGETLGGNKIIK